MLKYKEGKIMAKKQKESVKQKEMVEIFRKCKNKEILSQEEIKLSRNMTKDLRGYSKQKVDESKNPNLSIDDRENSKIEAGWYKEDSKKLQNCITRSIKEPKIREELKAMTDNFCQTFHKCSDEILSEPEKIPKEFKGKESEYIGKTCIKKVIEKAQK